MTPNVSIALRILLTLLISVASGERSFSKLKLIKNYLRSSMSQERSVGLAMISTENRIAQVIDFQTLLHDFASVVDLKSKEEKDAELDRKIEALRKKNEALVRRHKLIEEDRKRAEQEGIAVTTPRKGKQGETEPDKARKEKENFSITVDVNAGEKRVINEGKSPKLSHPSAGMELSPRSPTQRISGRTGLFSSGRSDDLNEPPVAEGDISPESERPARRRSQGMESARKGRGSDQSRRSPRGNRHGSPGERWIASPRGGMTSGDRGGRGPGRGGSVPGVGGDASGPDRKEKEWEERRRLNIEKMNEEMEKIAEYERSQRDGMREKNPMRNFLDDPRRAGPIADVDRKEGSRRHVRNWGGLDFERVKTGMDREKESHVRRPGMKNQVDMTMSMTGRERAEYMRWKQEREHIDQERLARHRQPTGQWKREWDAEKNESMFKDDSAPYIEEESGGRRDKGRRGTPKPHTMGEFLSESLGGYSQKRDRNRGRGRNKPYNMHDSRCDDPEDDNEKDVTVEREDKERRFEKVEEPQKQKVEEPQKEARRAVKPVEEDGEEDDEWTDASADEEEDISEDEQRPAEVDNATDPPVTPQPAPKTQRPPISREPPKLTIPSPTESPQEKPVESKPTSPFSPVEYQSVTDWGEEMEQLSNRGSSNEDSPPQITGAVKRSPCFDPSDPEPGKAAQEALQKTPDAVHNLEAVLESASEESSETDGESDLDGAETPERCTEEIISEGSSRIPHRVPAEISASDEGDAPISSVTASITEGEAPTPSVTASISEGDAPILPEVATILEVKASIPSEEASFPEIEASIPSEEASFPEMEASIPSEEASFPEIEASIPSEEASFPEIEASIPSEEASFPEIEASIPSEEASFPEMEASIPSEEASFPEIEASIPTEEASFLEIEAPVPSEEGFIPEVEASVLSEEGSLLEMPIASVQAPELSEEALIPEVEAQIPSVETSIPDVEVLKPSTHCVYIADYQTVLFCKDSLN
ncbi:coiled-coil domain-containing protein 9 [Pelodytes ibericus]